MPGVNSKALFNHSKIFIIAKINHKTFLNKNSYLKKNIKIGAQIIRDTFVHAAFSINNLFATKASE